MVERIIITLVICGGLALLWLGWQRYKANLMQSIRIDEISGGKPTLLYFTADYCASCKFQQTPIIDDIAAQFGNMITVRSCDVSIDPEFAGRYKVLTLPTTIVLDIDGRVISLNYGLAGRDRLAGQLLEAAKYQQVQRLSNELQHSSYKQRTTFRA